MTELYLHHYEQSPYSEKVRALLGYLELDWNSVIISNIMPRPDLMPLSGGYRKTPILQDGANVFCDSKVIALHLARKADNTELYGPGFAATRLAEWADTTLFQCAVALCFQPRAVAAFASALGEDALLAFQKDRAALTDGGAVSQLDPKLAEASFTHYLTELEASLSAPFLFGAAPSIADFSLYHGLWFVGNNPITAPLLQGYAHVADWYERMQAFSRKAGLSSDSATALRAGTDAEPSLVSYGELLLPEGLQIGDSVRVAPNDYGKVPVTGQLRHCSDQMIAIERADAVAGALIIYFPRTGFDIVAAT